MHAVHRRVHRGVTEAGPRSEVLPGAELPLGRDRVRCCEARAPAVVRLDDGHELRLVRMTKGMPTVGEEAAVPRADQRELNRRHARRLTAFGQHLPITER